MSGFDPEGLEQELSKLRPAKPPEELVCRISAAGPSAQLNRISRAKLRSFSSWLGRLAWPAAATAALFILFGLVHHKPLRTPIRDQAQQSLEPPGASLKADKVEISQQLVTSFYAVAQLADGEPVRLQCREWLDAVVLRDSTRGVVIERHAPRLEIIPVRFETY